MNKRGFAEGLSWFFAIIVTVLILVLFYASASFFSMSDKENRGDIYLGDFYNYDSLRQLVFIEDYNHSAEYNSLVYEIFLASPTNFLYSDSAKFLNITSRNIFSVNNLGFYPASVMFSFRSKKINWSAGNMFQLPDSLNVDSGNVFANLNSRGISVSNLAGRGMQTELSYEDLWDVSSGKASILIPEGRLYRVYFKNKYVGFVRFGISAATR